MVSEYKSQNSIEHFRRRAAEMRSEAQYIVDEKLRHELLRLAAGWERLAQHGEALATPPENTPASTDAPPDNQCRARDAATAH